MNCRGKDDPIEEFARLMNVAQNHFMRGNVLSADRVLERASGYARGIIDYTMQARRYTEAVDWRPRKLWALECAAVSLNAPYGVASCEVAS